MCEPTTIAYATLALATVSAGVQYDQGRRTANQQRDAIKRNEELQAMDAARQQSQLAAQGAEEMNAAQRQAMADMATLDAIAGEYGGGNTVNRTATVQGIQAGEQLATIRSNARTGLNEAAAGAFAARERSMSQLRNVQGPSLFGTALQIGGAALNSYSNYKSLTDPKWQKPVK